MPSETVSNQVSLAIGVIDILSRAVTKRGSGFPMILKYPASNDAANEALLDKLKDPHAQVVMPLIQEMRPVELQSATDICLTSEERTLYRQAIQTVANYLAGTK
jgi:hypothetical protein